MATLNDEETMEVATDLEKVPERGNTRAKEVAMAAVIVLTQFVQVSGPYVQSSYHYPSVSDTQADDPLRSGHKLCPRHRETTRSFPS